VDPEGIGWMDLAWIYRFNIGPSDGLSVFHTILGISSLHLHSRWNSRRNVCLDVTRYEFVTSTILLPGL
jgi:hypothetical protein